MPCSMARQGQYKYNYIHGHDPQLFDLKTDPGEWINLAADPAYSEIADGLRQAIIERFDPEAMVSRTNASLLRRQLIDQTMTRHGQTWCHFPEYDYRRGASDQTFPKDYHAKIALADVKGDDFASPKKTFALKMRDTFVA